MQALRRRTVAALGAAALSVPLVATAGAPAIAGVHHSTTAGHHSQPSARISFPSTKASWATAGRAATSLRSDTPLTVRVALRLRHQSQAEKAAVAASTPGSASFGHYLTAQQFQKNYGASAKTISQVSDYFRAQGMKITGSDWHGVTMRATVGSVERTFRTSLSEYQVNGKSLRAADRALSLPRSVGASVLTVTGVNQSGTVRRPMTARPVEPATPAVPTATPDSDYNTPPTCSDYWNEHRYTMPQAYGQTSFPTFICGYVPSQIRSAYGVSTLQGGTQTGSGAKVAIIDAYGSPTIVGDANKYAANHGDARFAKGQVRQKLFKPFVNQNACGGEAGWNGEETLDVEAVHGMAPDAQILYVGGKDCITGIDDAQQWVVDNASNPNSSAYGVSIVSNSYGFPGDEPNVIIDPAEQAMNHQTLIQAANEGIGFYFSSGDEGDNTVYGYSSRPQASYESSDPFATGVGGTSLAVDQNGSYLFETGWGSTLDPVTYNSDGNQTGYAQPLPGTFLFGGGGGVSTQFAQPSYQAGTVPDSLSQLFGVAKMRVAPDVSMVGDPYTGFLIGQTDPTTGVYAESSIGGTSLATPLFAGLQAVIQGSGPHIGFASPLLYTLRSAAFHDVVPPSRTVATPSASGHNLVTYDRDSSLVTAPGYDDVTGRGTPNGATFVFAERNKLSTQ